MAVSTGVRQYGTRTGLVYVDGEIGLAALDHDFHKGSIVTAVLLQCNIPSDMSGFFFCGDEFEGYGEIFVTLRDAIYDPSRVFDQAAHLIDITQMKELNPSVFVFQADGGTDRSIKRLQTKLLWVAVFKRMDFDHLLALWSAPNGSAHDRVERAMSPLGFALMNVATKRKPMAEWAEKYVKYCGSMSKVRAVRDKNVKVQEADISGIVELKKQDEQHAVSSILKDLFNNA